MKWKIKKFEELSTKELYEILKLRAEVFVVEQNCVYQDVDSKDEKSYHLFLEENNTLVAYSRIIPRKISYDEVSIGRVIIKKAHRGSGLAKEMMLNAIDFIKNSMNEESIRISAQAYLIDFYKSVGFKEVSEIYLEDDIEHIEMLYNK
ncbi:MAG: GNAT family N-acetyltransferase [Peptostreptococcaceae bacterium]